MVHCFNPTSHAGHSMPQKSGKTVSGFTYHAFWAPQTKTMPRGEFIMWTDSLCDCSVQWAFTNNLSINSRVPASDHIFKFETDDGTFAPMKCAWFMARCNEVWLAKGLQALSGHSFRIGSTTHLLLMGINPFIVMVQGHWKSSTFLEYWRSCKEIIPTFIGFFQSSKASILSTMSAFKQHLLDPI